MKPSMPLLAPVAQVAASLLALASLAAMAQATVPVPVPAPQGPAAAASVPAPATPAANPSAASPTVARNAPPGHSPALRSGQRVTVNFVNADIEAVTRAFASMIQRQIAVDPRVRGNITVYSEQALTVREAYLNYMAALRGLGFAVVESAGLLKVVPEADAKLQTGTVSVGEVTVRGDQVITQIFTLRHENANNLVAVLRPLISANNTINVSPGTNALVITDYADNLQRIARMVSALDVPAVTDVEVVPLQHAIAADLAVLVQRLADGGTGAAAGVPSLPGAGGGSGSVTVIPESRSNALIIRAPNAARLAQVKGLIERLDRPSAGGLSGPGGQIWVVHLRNADAVKLATVLRASFGGGAGGAGPASPISAQQVPVPGAAGGASPQATAPLAASAQPSTGGGIQADPATNSLIITAPEPLYRQMRAVIDQLDSRRAQVYIESMIVTVNAQKLAEFGVQWQGISGQKGDNTIVGGGTNFGNGTANIINLSAAAAQGRTGLASVVQAGVPGGFNIGLLKKIGEFYTLGALARLLETQADGNVLSTPNLIALDNEEAKFISGQNVPFVTGSFTNSGGGGGATNPFQTIERKDVGLTLRVRPQIGEGGTIRLTIFQENSSVDPSSRSSPQGLITDKSSIETNVVVDDGQIMVLGGLMKDEFTGGVSKVPLLGDIPLLGHLFRADNRTRTKNNLMVFLRPIIVRDPDTANALTLDRYDRIRALQTDAQPSPSRLLPINDSPQMPAPPAGMKGGPAVPPPLGLPPGITPVSPASGSTTP
jgi:general secretion pathway protein D